MTTLAMPQPTFVPTKRREESAMSDFVEQKIFTSEIKRVDSEMSNIKKAAEKQDKNVAEAINGLRKDVNDLEKGLRGAIKDLRDEMHSSFRWLVGMYLTGLGATLAAFYAFASYIKG